MNPRALLTLGLMLSAAGQANADSLVLSSGSEPVTLVELFTSEGCNSCPPADRHLSNLTTDKGLWRDFVPLAFHVDYWDYLGWQDRFANADYSDRQRRYALEGGVRVVYTPGFFAGGKEWRNWRRDGLPAEASGMPGVLRAEVTTDTVNVHWDGETTDAQPLASVALLGMSLSSSVKAGENRGKKLRHDFVVLDVTSASLTPVEDGYAVSAPLPESSVGAEQFAIAVWVTDGRTQAPLQATGGYLPTGWPKPGLIETE
ncbi:MAG: DUF1223 domain-containing protein [Pseudomonadota bacterium]